MPLAFKPGHRFAIILSGDKADPSPPKFYARAMTCAETMDFADNFDALSSLTGREAIQRICDALRGVLVGWEGLIGADGQPVPYEPAKLEQIFSLGEARELVAACLAGRMGDDDVKK